MSDKRQKNQLVLAFTEEGRSEAPKTSQEGTESRTAKCETERPASHEQLMEEVCERENCSLSCTSTEAQSKRGKECGGSTSRAEVPGVQLQQQQRTEAAHCAKGPVALQAENSGTDETDTRDQSGADAEGTYGLLKGLEELLRLLSDSFAAANSGPMDTASFAFHNLEAMETRPSAVREATSTRGR